MTIEGELKSIRLQLEAVLKRLGHIQALPRRATLKQAALQLGCGLTKLREQIARKEVLAIRDGGKWFVPQTELERLCQPTTKRRGRKPKALPKSKDVEHELRELTKGR